MFHIDAEPYGGHGRALSPMLVSGVGAMRVRNGRARDVGGKGHGGPMGFVRDVLANVAAAGVLAVLAGALALSAAWVARRSRVWQLFGVGTSSRNSVLVIVPSFDIKPQSASGTRPVLTGFVGTAISELEYREALGLAEALRANPAVRLLQAVGLPERIVYRPVRCRVTASMSASEFAGRGEAAASQEIKDMVRGADCVVLVGGPVYNTTTDVLLREAPFAFEFFLEDRQGEPVRGVRVRAVHGNTGRELRRRVEPAAGGAGSVSIEYAVVEAVDWEGTRVFLCAGTCAAATAAAVRTVSQGWRQLAGEYGRSGFGLVYELPVTSDTARDRAPEMRSLQQCHAYRRDG